MEKKRGLKFYWEFMDTPVIIFSLFTLLTLIFPLTNYVGTTIASIISFAVIIFVFGFVGFKISRRENKKEEVRYGKAGAWSGAVMGLISAVLGILSFYLLPANFTQAIQNAVNSGASASTVMTFLQVGLFVGLILTPVIYGLLGALITWISKFVFKEKPKSKEDKEWIKSEPRKK